MIAGLVIVGVVFVVFGVVALIADAVDRLPMYPPYHDDAEDLPSSEDLRRRPIRVDRGPERNAIRETDSMETFRAYMGRQR